jgi:hypothetical protein
MHSLIHPGCNAVPGAVSFGMLCPSIIAYNPDLPPLLMTERLGRVTLDMLRGEFRAALGPTAIKWSNRGFIRYFSPSWTSVSSTNNIHHILVNTTNTISSR